MELEEAEELISYAVDKHEKEELWLRWIVGGYEKQYSFDDFVAELTPKPKQTAQTIESAIETRISEVTSWHRD